MEKLYTKEEYANSAIEANNKGELLYVYVHDMEYQEQVLEWTYKDEEVPIYDEEGNPTGETQIIQVPDQPIMETVTEVDPITGEEVTYERQKFHYETRVKEVAELLVAPANYYICYEENYTRGEVNPSYEADKEEAEKARIANLKCTKRVLALCLQEYGVSYSQLKELIASDEQAQLEWDLCVELERKNPLLDVMGAELGITPKQLDNIFRLANGEEIENADTTDTTEPTINADEIPQEGV